MEAVKRRKVIGIIPRESVSSMINQSNTSNFDVAKTVIKAAEHEQEQMRVAQKEGRKQDAEFSEVRTRMICSAFGIDEKELEEFKKELEQFEKDSAGKRPIDVLRDKRNRWNSKVKGIEKEDTNTAADIVGKVGKAGVFLGGIFCASVVEEVKGILASIVAILPIELRIGIAAAGLVAGAAYTGYRYMKKRKGAVSDAKEDERDYEEELKPFLKQVKQLEECIDRNKDFIMHNKQTMPPELFESFLTVFLKNQIDSLGLSGALDVSKLSPVAGYLAPGNPAEMKAQTDQNLQNTPENKENGPQKESEDTGPQNPLENGPQKDSEDAGPQSQSNVDKNLQQEQQKLNEEKQKENLEIDLEKLFEERMM